MNQQQPADTKKGREVRTWAAVASAPPRPSSDQKALREIKVRITDTQERKALWTTSNKEVLDRVAKKADGVGVVGIKKLPSGDIVVQTREREGRDRLAGRRAWIESVAPSA